MFIERHSHKKYLLPIIILSVVTVMLLAGLVWGEYQLVETRGMLTSAEIKMAGTQAELAQTQADLAATRTGLAQTQADLAAARTGLAQAQTELTITRVSLTQTQTDLAFTRTNLIQTQTNLAAAQTRLSTAEVQIGSLETTFDNLQTNYQRLTTGYGYVLQDPTYQAVKDFLAGDRTDENTYNITSYNCSDFSADVIANAARQNIRSGYVPINFPGTIGHAIVVFNTTDRGLIYIEPQSDEEVNLRVGKHYYDSVIPMSGYYYARPSYDDTVVRFIVVW